MHKATERPLFGWLLAAFALTMLALGWGEVFSPLANTSFGVSLVPSGQQVVVQRVDPAAAKSGVRKHDEVDLSALSLSDRNRLLANAGPPGTTLSLPLVRGNVHRSVTLLAQSKSNFPVQSFGAVSFLINLTISLTIAALIALRRPSLATAALVCYAAGSTTTLAIIAQFTWLPNPLFGGVAVAISCIFGSLPEFALLPFIVRFPATPKSGAARTRMHIADAFFVSAAIAFLYEAIYEPITFVSWPTFNLVMLVAPVLATLVFVALAYRDAAGETRRRMAWVLAGVVISAISYSLFNYFDILSLTTGSATFRLISWIAALGQTALMLALAYAVLRHRVLDIGFAINRTVVYAVITTIVVGVVSLVDWLCARMLSEQRLALAVEALVTIAFGFALNWIHGRTERLVDSLVFRQRHVAEKRIEYRIGALAFATSTSAVEEALAIDAAEILNLSSAAVFSRLITTQPFTRSVATGWGDGTETRVEDDSLLVRTLRSLERPFFLDDVAIAVPEFPSEEQRPALAIPIVAQHELIGFVLYGHRPDGTSPDPEEIALLARLASAAGNAYGAVEVRQWRERAAALQLDRNGTIGAQLPA